jgi:ribosomal protein S18 acetylase RimI-like enzyme
MDAAEGRFPGAKHMFLCVSSFNGRARRFYERRGYSQVGEFPDYIVEGASEILMHKRLAPQ